MVASIDNMRKIFIQCNKKYFDGKLPVPGFELAHTIAMALQEMISQIQLLSSQTIMTFRKKCS